MKEKLIEYVESSAITFIATFLLVIAPLLSAFDFSEGIDRAAILSIAATGARGGLKAAWDMVIRPLCLYLLTRRKPKEVDLE